MSLRFSRHVLEDETRELVEKEVIEGVGSSLLDPDEDSEILAAIGAEALRRHLPFDALADIESFRDSGRHVLVMRNLPTPPLPPTPVTGFCDEPPLALVNALQLGLIRLMKLVPFAVPYENGGRLLRNVAPNQDYLGTASSWGADSEFFWHTDNPQLPFGRAGIDPRPYIPRFLSLLGLRNEEQVATDVAAIESALALLDDETLAALQRPSFEAGAPASNDDAQDGTRMTMPDTSVLERHSDGMRVRYDRDTVRGVTEEASAAQERWNDVLGRVDGSGSVLDTGDFLVFDNYRVLHRRAAFTPTSNPRWLRRCYAS